MFSVTFSWLFLKIGDRYRRAISTHRRYDNVTWTLIIARGVWITLHRNSFQQESSVPFDNTGFERKREEYEELYEWQYSVFLSFSSSLLLSFSLIASFLRLALCLDASRFFAAFFSQHHSYHCSALHKRGTQIWTGFLVTDQRSRRV